MAVIAAITLACGAAAAPTPTLPSPTAEPTPTIASVFATPGNPTQPTPTPPPTIPLPQSLLLAFASCRGQYADDEYRYRYESARSAISDGQLTVDDLKAEVASQCPLRPAGSILTAPVRPPTVAPIISRPFPTPEQVRPTPLPEPSQNIRRQLASVAIAIHAAELALEYLREPAATNPFLAFILHQAEAQDCNRWAFEELDLTTGHRHTDPDQSRTDFLTAHYALPIAVARGCYRREAQDLFRTGQWLKLSAAERHQRYQELLPHTLNYHYWSLSYPASRLDTKLYVACHRRFLERPPTAQTVIIPADRYQQDEHAIRRCLSQPLP